MTYEFSITVATTQFRTSHRSLATPPGGEPNKDDTLFDYIEKNRFDRRHPRPAGDEHNIPVRLAHGRPVERDSVAFFEILVDVRRTDAVRYEPELEFDTRVPANRLFKPITSTVQVRRIRTAV